jgi:hypothetical protein
MNSLFLKVTWFMLCWISWDTLCGQEIPLIRYGKENGLPSNTIYVAYRDSKGFLWLGTDRGVSRYNGVYFENFNTSDGLADNDILAFVEDREGRLWMGTYNGALCFYTDGRFHSAANTAFLKLPFKKAFTYRMVLERDSSVTLAFHQQPLLVNISGDNVKIIDLKPLGVDGDPESLMNVRKIPGLGYDVVTKERNLLVDTSGRLIQMKPNKVSGIIDGSWEQLRTSDGIYDLEGNELLSFVQSRNLKQYRSAGLKVFKVAAVDDHRFLFTEDGIWIDDSLHLLNDKAAPDMIADKAGNYWIPTSDGLYRISTDLFGLTQYRNVCRKVSYARADSSGILFASEYGDLYEFRNNRFRTIYRYKPKAWHIPLTHQVSCLIDARGNYYCFFRNSHVVVKDVYGSHPAANEYRDVLHFQWKNLFTMPGKLYALLFDQIQLVEYEKQKPGTDLLMRKLPGNIYRERIFSSDADSSGSIFYSTVSRVYNVVNDSAVVQPQFGKATFKWMKICGDYLIGLTHEDRLLICNNFTTKGITIDTIRERGIMWTGAYKLDNTHVLLTTNHFYRIVSMSASLGRPWYSVSALENPYIPADADYVCAGGGNCWFFKDQTIYRMGMERLLKKNALPGVVFTSVRTQMDTTYFDDTLTHHISIPFSRSRNIIISFAALSFNSAEIIYEYCVSSGQGANRWITVKNEEVNLVAPGYGDHRVRVRARTPSGGYCEPVVLYLTILKPFWARPWFLVLLTLVIFLAAICSVIAGFRISFRRKEKKHAAEIRFMKSEYKALNALMNPHFIFNSLNSIQGLVNDNNKAAAIEYLQYFSELVRQNMHNISQEQIPLQKELELVENYLRLEQFRFDGWLNYQVEIGEEVETEVIFIPPLLIQPLVENTLKHGLLPKQSSDNMLVLRVYEQANDVLIEIEDNGVGLHHPSVSGKQHGSIGLSNLQKRISHLNLMHRRNIRFAIEELLDETGDVKGTLAILRIDA